MISLAAWTVDPAGRPEASSSALRWESRRASIRLVADVNPLLSPFLAAALVMVRVPSIQLNERFDLRFLPCRKY